METPKRQIRELKLQTVSQPAGNSLVIEFVDENDDALISMIMDTDGQRKLIISQSNEDLIIPLREFEMLITKAKERIVFIDPEGLFN